MPNKESIHQLSDKIQSGEISSEELTRQSLAAIERLNPELNAFVSQDAEGAIRTARQRDVERSKGKIRSILHGIPVAIKDIIDLKGQVTSLGSSLHLDNLAHEDAKVIRLLRRAGAVIVGKSTLHEFAYGATGDRSAHGASRNPHDSRRISGGSSGGSAVAVASGIVPLSLGTDTAGSVRVPAGLCGVVGFKPAYDAISTAGVFPLARSLDHTGLFCHTVDDARLVYRLLASRASSSPEAGKIEPRIGWFGGGPSSLVDARILEVLHASLHHFGQAPQAIALPDITALGFVSTFELFTTIQASEAALIHRDDITRGDGVVDTEVLQRLTTGTEIRAWKYLKAVEARALLSQAVRRIFDAHDILISPNVGITAPLVGERSAVINGESHEVRSTLLAFTHLWNLVGYPAISIPAGLVDGLPISVQLIARPGSEDTLFLAAGRLESLFNQP